MELILLTARHAAHHRGAARARACSPHQVTVLPQDAGALVDRTPRRRRARRRPPRPRGRPRVHPAARRDGHVRAGDRRAHRGRPDRGVRRVGGRRLRPRHRRAGRARRPAAAGRRAPRRRRPTTSPAGSRSASSRSTRPPTPPGCPAAALDLTYKEFELLKFLAQHPGRVFTRSHLVQEVWGYDYFGGTRTVDVHVRRLRAKLGAEHEAMIGTVRNVGYKFVRPSDAGAAPARRRRRRRRRRRQPSSTGSLDEPSRRADASLACGSWRARSRPRCPTTRRRSAIRRLAVEVEQADGAPPLSDQALTPARRRPPSRTWSPHDDGRLVRLRPARRRHRSRSPRDVDVAGRRCSTPASAPGGCWSGRTAGAAGCVPPLERRGFDRARELLPAAPPARRRAPLPDDPPLPDGVVVRAFVPGRDDDAVAGRQRRRVRRPPRAGQLDPDDLQARIEPSVVRPGRLPAGRARRRAARLPLDEGAPGRRSARCTCWASRPPRRAWGWAARCSSAACATWPARLPGRAALRRRRQHRARPALRAGRLHPLRPRHPVASGLATTARPAASQ